MVTASQTNRSIIFHSTENKWNSHEEDIPLFIYKYYHYAFYLVPTLDFWKKFKKQKYFRIYFLLFCHHPSVLINLKSQCQLPLTTLHPLPPTNPFSHNLKTLSFQHKIYNFTSSLFLEIKWQIHFISEYNFILIFNYKFHIIFYFVNQKHFTFILFYYLWD